MSPVMGWMFGHLSSILFKVLKPARFLHTLRSRLNNYLTQTPPQRARTSDRHHHVVRSLLGFLCCIVFVVQSQRTVGRPLPQVLTPDGEWVGARARKVAALVPLSLCEFTRAGSNKHGYKTRPTQSITLQSQSQTRQAAEGTLPKQDQRRGYHTWATTSSCTSGTEKATRISTEHAFELNKGRNQLARPPRSF